MKQLSALLADLRLRRRHRVGVACSGGLDSVVLLHAARDAARQRGFTLLAIHVQHGLRGQESADDEMFVRVLCTRLGVPLVVEPAEIARTTPGSLEDRARKARYRIFRAMAEAERLTHFLLAHHEDDQVESVLMRIRRGAGPRGLQGMPRERPLLPGCRLVRPFLALPRQIIREAAAECDLAWREDSSNFDLRFERNRVRHVVLPKLIEVLPDARERLLRVARLARTAHAAVEKSAERIDRLARLISLPGLAAFSLPTLRAAPIDVVHRVLSGEMERSGGPPLGRRTFSRLEALIAEDSPSRTLALPGGSRARRERDLLWLQTSKLAADPVDPLPVPGLVQWKALRAKIRTSTVPGGRRVTAALDEAKRDPWLAVLDAGALDGGLCVRTRRPGDLYHPLGAPGRRRLKRLFIERGLPRFLRPVWPLVCDRTGILWTPGFPPAERARVSSRTHRALKLKWKAEDAASCFPEPSGRGAHPNERQRGARPASVLRGRWRRPPG